MDKEAKVIIMLKNITLNVTSFLYSVCNLKPKATLDLLRSPSFNPIVDCNAQVQCVVLQYALLRLPILFVGIEELI